MAVSAPRRFAETPRWKGCTPMGAGEDASHVAPLSKPLHDWRVVAQDALHFGVVGDCQGAPLRDVLSLAAAKLFGLCDVLGPADACRTRRDERVKRLPGQVEVDLVLVRPRVERIPLARLRLTFAPVLVCHLAVSVGRR